MEYTHELRWQFRQKSGPLAGLIVGASYPCFYDAPTKRHFCALAMSDDVVFVELIERDGK